MTDLKLIQWAKDKYPPIDLNSHHNDVYKLINAYNELQADNERLRELERGFYMSICRAYNAGKNNMMSMVAESKKMGESVDTFKSSHEYFIGEFPKFTTNVP